MVTKEEFLGIVETHLKVRNDGSIFVDDPKLGIDYVEYIKKQATKSDDDHHDNTRFVIANIYQCMKS